MGGSGWARSGSDRVTPNGQDGEEGEQRAAARIPPSWPPPPLLPARFQSAHWSSARRWCVEARQGHLYIFMPPIAWLEDYLDLLPASTDRRAALDMRIVLEGYPPPRDPRVKLL